MGIEYGGDPDDVSLHACVSRVIFHSLTPASNLARGHLLFKEWAPLRKFPFGITPTTSLLQVESWHSIKNCFLVGRASPRRAIQTMRIIEGGYQFQVRVRTIMERRRKLVSNTFHSGTKAASCGTAPPRAMSSSTALLFRDGTHSRWSRLEAPPAAIEFSPRGRPPSFRRIFQPFPPRNTSHLRQPELAGPRGDQRVAQR